MQKQAKLTLLVILLFLGSFFAESAAQNNDRKFNLSFNINYTTTAKLYLNPKSSDEITRNNYMPLEKIVSPSLDIRYNITDEFIVGLSTEYLKKTAIMPDLLVASPRGTMALEVEDGFKLIPVEISAYYLLPFSSETFKLYMGGGLAYYYGEQIRKFSDVEVSNLHRDFAYGIQFSIATDYMLTKFLSMRGEMKFRDPEFEVTSQYNRKSIVYQNQTIFITQNSFISKINVDGITFTFGLALHF
ncbi:MAG: outer membrane beta-barrel protein [Clostridiales bacterium]